MELSKSKILLLYFLKRKLFLYFRKWNPALFKPGLENRKNYPLKKVLIFSENGTLWL